MSAGHGHGTHGHGHGHGTADDLDWAEMAPVLEREAEIHLPFLGGAAAWLRDTLAGAEGAGVRRVVDVGSGPGVAACVLAGAFPRAEVLAVDGTPDLLDRAAARAERLGVGARLTTRRLDLPEGFDELRTALREGADLIWTSRVVHHLGDQQGALDALARALRPGGVLAVVEGGLTTRCLPRDIGIGRPGLQARLDVATEDWFAAMRAGLPGTIEVDEDWPALLRRAGLEATAARSFLVDLPAPLDAPVPEHLHTRLSRVHEQLADVLDAEDRETLRRLVSGDPDTDIRWRADAFYLTAFTVHIGRAPLG